MTDSSSKPESRTCFELQGLNLEGINPADIDSCLLADRANLRSILKAMQRNAQAGKPYDRLRKRLQQQLDASLKTLEARRQAPMRLSYDDNLPICEKRDDILALLQAHQVVVLAGETGSGKTTQLPKLCLELQRGLYGMIGHTQPRRLAARSVAARIAEELQVEVGGTIGYQVRFSDQLAEQTRVKLMTDGILLAEIQNDPLLLRYDTLIIDEAHERSLNIDFLLGYLKRILPRRPDLKLIITSATIDLERFAEHFDQAPVIEVSGRTYPVELVYRPLADGDEDNRDLDLQQAIVNAVREIEHWEQQGEVPGRNGDVLVFLSGERDIRETAEALRKQQLRDTEVLPLYARLSNAEQNRIFHPSGRGRRIVLATNVAETSLTVPGIRYVIDPGLARISRYSYRAKVQRLPIEAISQASANQRKGRCGRVSEGLCIRLYSEEDFQSRPEFTDAEILRTNLAAVILQMAGLKLGRVEDFPFIDPPDPRFIRDGERLLQELQALDKKAELTPIGRQLSRLPVDPRIGRMLLEAAANQCLTEVLVIASALSIQDPRERPLDKQQQADQKHREHTDPDSDFIGLLNLWNQYEEQRQALSSSQLRNYCRKYFLNFMRMREWRDLHRQLHLACRELGLQENKNPVSGEAVHRSLLAGLLGQIGMRQEEGDYLGPRNRRFHIFPGSVLAKQRKKADSKHNGQAADQDKKQGKGKAGGPPKWLMAAELVETSRVFARTVARMDPSWVEPLAQHLIKRSYSEPHWERKPAQVVAYEQQTLYGLPVVAKRKVHYGAIEPDESQQIFIRAALVEGDFQTSAPFFQHNREQLQEVAALEDKSRRRDILIDEQQLYDFYRQKLLEHQGEKVVNGASFENWRKQLEAKDPKALFVSREQLMQHDAAAINQQRYPDRLEWQGMSFPLSYRFEPGKADDGVTLTVPVAALSHLPVTRLEWLVPGMIKDKCVAMLRALPKQVRKNFVPIPDYVDAFLESYSLENHSLESASEAFNPQPDTALPPLTEALQQALRRMTGVRINAEDWSELEIEPHYLFNIRVLDENGDLLAEGRDWQALFDRFGDRQQQPVAQSRHELEREEVQGWDFAELPAEVELQQAGMTVKAYPALVVQQDKSASEDKKLQGKKQEGKKQQGKKSQDNKKQQDTNQPQLAIRLQSDPRQAELAHRDGVIELIRREISDPLAYLKKQLPNWQQTALLFTKTGTEKQLWSDFCYALIKRCFIERHDSGKNSAEGYPQPGDGYLALPRDGSAFQALIKAGLPELHAQGVELAALLHTILLARQPLLKKLSGNISLETATVMTDIRGQLDNLVYPGFLRDTPAEWLQRYPLYLEAISQRLGKFQRDLNQQRAQSETLQALWQPYQQKQQSLPASAAQAQAWQHYRWMLEELRISLFAQQLGTRMTVSEKRVAKYWREQCT